MALRLLQEAGGFYLLLRREDGAFVGYACRNPEPVPNIGFSVAKRHRGNGYATEAAACLVGRLFEEGAERVESGTAFENLPARRVLEKLGMRLTGTKMTSFVEDEEGAPIRFLGCAYAVTREEWEAAHRVRELTHLGLDGAGSGCHGISALIPDPPKRKKLSGDRKASVFSPARAFCGF